MSVLITGLLILIAYAVGAATGSMVEAWLRGEVTAVKTEVTKVDDAV